jgi:osmotically-inducible protein OsmY
MNGYRLTAPALLLLSCAAAQNQLPKDLSQYGPLNVSRVSTFGESRLGRDVHRQLRRLPYFGVFDHLAYSVDSSQDAVSLFGRVMRPELKQAAENMVMAIEGVQGLTNHIGYLSSSPETNRTRLAVFGAIYGDRVLGRYALVDGGTIHIVVEGHTVTLEGVVATAGDSRRAAELAARARGVLKVSNHLSVAD